MHSQPVDSTNPALFVFLVDQSYSMTEGLAGSSRPKCDAVASIINRFIRELILLSSKGEEKPRHYFDVSVFGYTTEKTGDAPVITPLLAGPLAGQDVVSIIDLYDHQDNELSDAGNGKDQRFEPVWYRTPPAEAMLGTPMCSALDRCRQIAGDWCGLHARSFPPVIVHLTDGESTDGNPEPVAERLQSLGTQDGNLLLFNCHLSGCTAEPIRFPSSMNQLPDEYARMLYRMSSVLPDTLVRRAQMKSIPAAAGARGMVFNADSISIVQLLSVGTPVVNRR